MRIRLASQARADLDGIWLYTAQETSSQPSATRLIGSITSKFALLARFPQLGKSLDSLSRPNIRTFPANNYVIFYSQRSAELRILRIIHASRDAMAVFAEQ